MKYFLSLIVLLLIILRLSESAMGFMSGGDFMNARDVRKLSRCLIKCLLLPSMLPSVFAVFTLWKGIHAYKRLRTYFLAPAYPDNYQLVV